jgi:hypothetical protein
LRPDHGGVYNFPMNPYRYVLHGNDRVYLDGREVFTEYRCAHCDEEVIQEKSFLVRGSITGPAGLTAALHDSGGNAVHLHREHVAHYILGKLMAFS